ncbi:hypothetical protein G6F24_017397 [Rhizopus arrhizus]|nr:hypothetical protein G6F24_017397 [Rhizopus arrhizus]
MPVLWIAGKQWLARRYYQRLGQVEEQRAGGRQRADPAGPDGGAALGPARTRLPRGGGDAALGGVALAAYSPGVHRGRVPDVPGRAGLHRADLWVRAEHRRVPAGVHRAERRRLA